MTKTVRPLRTETSDTSVRNIRYLDALPGVGKTTWCLQQLLDHRKSQSLKTKPDSHSWYVGPTYDLLLQVAVDYLDLLTAEGLDARPRLKVMLSASYANKVSTRNKKELARLQAAGCLLMQGSEEDARAGKSFASPAGTFFLNHVASDNKTCTYFLTHDLLQCLPSSTSAHREDIVENILSNTNLWFDEARRCTTKSKSSFRLSSSQFADLLILLGLEDQLDVDDPIQIPPATVAVLRDCMYCAMDAGEKPDLAALQAEHPSLRTLTEKKILTLSYAMAPKQNFTALLRMIASHSSTVWLMPPGRNTNTKRPRLQTYPLYIVEDVFRLLCKFKRATLMAAYFRCSEMYFTIRQSLLDLGLTSEAEYWDKRASVPYTGELTKRKAAIEKRWRSLRITYLCKSNEHFFLSKNSLVSGLIVKATDAPKFMEDARQKGHINSGFYANATRHALGTGRPSLLEITYGSAAHDLVAPWKVLFNRALLWSDNKKSTGQPLLVVNKALNTPDSRDETMDDEYSEFMHSARVRDNITKLSSRSYGLNIYQDRNVLIYLAALNLDDGMSRFLTRRLSRPTRALHKRDDTADVYSVQEDTVVESAVQAICRTAVRNLSVATYVHVLVGTQALANALKRHMLDAPKVFCVKDPYEFLSWTAAKLKPKTVSDADRTLAKANTLCRVYKSTLKKALSLNDAVSENKARKNLERATARLTELKTQLFRIEDNGLT